MKIGDKDEERGKVQLKWEKGGRYARYAVAKFSKVGQRRQVRNCTLSRSFGGPYGHDARPSG